MSSQYTSFFFSLDEILDTRLAVLNILDPEATFELLKDGYFERDIDDWETLTKGKIKNKDFLDLYKKRDVEVLKKSRLTAFGEYLSRFIIDAEKMFGEDPTVNIPRIFLNVYPYILSAEELEAIKTAVSIACRCTFTEVEVCYYSQEEITPNKVKNEYDFCFMYHFETWKNKHIEEIGKQVLMGCYINAPRLFISEKPTEEDNDMGGGLKMTPWQAAEVCMLPFMVLNLIPVSIFSLYVP